MEQIFTYLSTNWMDTLGVCLGLLYLWLEIRENAWMWVVGCIMPVIYIFVLYRAGIYGDCLVEVYAFFAGIYGLFYWLRSRRVEGTQKHELPITYAPGRTRLWLLIITAVAWATLSYLLANYTDSRVPIIDGFTTALYFVALWMLSRKYIEQWWVWFVMDALSSGLYIYKGVYGRALLYAIYTVIACYGYWEWKKRMQQPTPGNE